MSDIDNPRSLSDHIFQVVQMGAEFVVGLTKRQFADGPPIWADQAKEHDEFMRRFRVPYQFFLTIIAGISDSGREWFPRRHRRGNIP